jgi:hypothetical protein
VKWRAVGVTAGMAASYEVLKAQYDEFAAVLSEQDRLELEQDLVAVQRLEAEAELFAMLEPLLLRHRDLFRDLDRDSNGKVTVEEFVSAFNRRRVTISEEKVRELFQVLDVNGDGSVEIDEFMDQMRKAKLAMRQQLKTGPSGPSVSAVPGASNLNRRRFPGLSAVHLSSSAPELEPPSANLSALTERSLSRRSPPPFVPGKNHSITGELAEFTNVWVAKELEADRQRRGALSQVRHAVLHKSTHLDLAPAGANDSAEHRRRRAQRRRSHGVGIVNGRRQIWGPCNPSKAKTDITLRGSIVSGNARSEYDAFKDLEFARGQDARRRWIDGDMVPPDGRPKDIHNPLTLMSADMPSLTYERFYTADRSRENLQRLNATYAARTAALVPFTAVSTHGRTATTHSKHNPIALKENLRAQTKTEVPSRSTTLDAMTLQWEGGLAGAPPELI